MIAFVRSLLFTLIMFISAPIFSFCCLVTYRLPYERRYRILSKWPSSMITLAKYLCGIQYEIVGQQNIPSDNAIIVSNHQSTWETLAFFTIFPHACFVLKKELLQLPIFGWCLRLLEPIALDRKATFGAIEQLLAQGQARLDAHRSVIIFPEGHRMPVEKRGKFKTGAAQLALKSQKPLLPVSIDSGKYWPRHAFIKKPGTIRVVIGKPIESDNLSPMILTEQVKEAIESQLRTAQPVKIC